MADSKRNLKTIREQLLKLPDVEKKEREKVRVDYYFYKGRCEDEAKAKHDKALLGQNWELQDNIGYIPTQEIRNKVKPLIKKQARFMFGKEPTITLKPKDIKDKEKCEELRQFIDKVFMDKTNQFWKKTRKAFLNSTIKKRVLLRVEANPNSPILIRYEDIEDFYYKEINNVLVEAKFFEEDKKNIYAKEDSEKIYYIHRYYYNKLEESEEISAFYQKLTYKGDKLNEAIADEPIDTGFSIIPCWLIKNGGELNEEFGESDIEDLKDIQNNYNRTVSDYRDALRFEMFGAEAVIDGNQDDVNNFVIAPGALHAVKTDQQAAAQGKQAVVQRIEYSFSSSGAVNNYLDRSMQDMNFVLDMPSIKDMNNIPSAKAMKYLYNDLIARCEEKWSDWQPVFEELIHFIINAAKYCYSDFKEEWKSLEYTILFERNYPIPSDEEDKKKIGMDEVASGVRSKKSYIKEFTDEEDSEESYKEILEEKSLEAGIEMGELSPGNKTNAKNNTDKDEEDEEKEDDLNE